MQKTKRKWIVAIRRENFTATPHTSVCSRHLKREDVREPGYKTERRLLNKGAVLALFQSNNFSVPLSRPGVWERRERPTRMVESPGNSYPFETWDGHHGRPG